MITLKILGNIYDLKEKNKNITFYIKNNDDFLKIHVKKGTKYDFRTLNNGDRIILSATIKSEKIKISEDNFIESNIIYGLEFIKFIKGE